MPGWWMWLQVINCLIGSAGFIWTKNYPMAWVWFCYSAANLGFVKLAGGF